MSTRSNHRLDRLERAMEPPEPAPGAFCEPPTDAERQRRLDELQAIAERRGLTWPPLPNPYLA